VLLPRDLSDEDDLSDSAFFRLSVGVLDLREIEFPSDGYREFAGGNFVRELFQSRGVWLGPNLHDPQISRIGRFGLAENGCEYAVLLDMRNESDNHFMPNRIGYGVEFVEAGNVSNVIQSHHAVGPETLRIFLLGGSHSRDHVRAMLSRYMHRGSSDSA
jgi:hypothetical protein